MGHVFVRMSGYGLRLLPFWPYRFARTGDHPSQVQVVRWTADGAVEAMVSIGNRSSVPGVVDVADGPYDGHWLIETSVFTCAWPEGFTVNSSLDPADSTKFYLHSPNDASIFPQGPLPTDRVPRTEQWAAPGQSIIAAYQASPDVEVVELGYTHEGEPWWQAHWMIPHGPQRTLVISAQAPVAEAGNVRAATGQVAASVTPTRRDSAPNP